MKSEHDHLILGNKFTGQVNKITRLFGKISKLSKLPDQKKTRDELKKARSELSKAVREIRATIKALEALKMKPPFYKKLYKNCKELSDAVMKVFVHHCEYQALILLWDQFF